MNENESSQKKLSRLLNNNTLPSTNTFGKHLKNIIKLILFHDSKSGDNRLLRLSNINKESYKKIRHKIQKEIQEFEDNPMKSFGANKENKNLGINQKMQSKISRKPNKSHHDQQFPQNQYIYFPYSTDEFFARSQNPTCFQTLSLLS